MSIIPFYTSSTYETTILTFSSVAECLLFLDQIPSHKVHPTDRQRHKKLIQLLRDKQEESYMDKEDIPNFERLLQGIQLQNELSVSHK
jgi:hypothetical protein